MSNTTNPLDTVLGTTARGPIIQLFFNMCAGGDLSNYLALLLTLRAKQLSSCYSCELWACCLQQDGENGGSWQSIQ